MENFIYFGLARALHVVCVVLWIGGVAFVTTTLIPSLRKMTDTDKRLLLFEQLEGKFAFQARIVTLVTGLTGFYMLEYMQAWGRYREKTRTPINLKCWVSSLFFSLTNRRRAIFGASVKYMSIIVKLNSS